LKCLDNKLQQDTYSQTTGYNFGGHYSATLNDDYLHKRHNKRRNIRNKQLRRLIAAIILIPLFLLLLPPVLFSSFETMFFNNIKNAGLKLKVDYPIFKKAESLIANDYFLNLHFLGSVETKKAQMTPLVFTGKMPRLENRLKYIVNQYPMLDAGIFVYDIQTGRYAEINADKEFPAASIIKIPVLLELFKRVEMGLIDLKEEVPIQENDITDGSGLLQYRPAGTKFSVMDYARLMIQQSDNTATNVLLAKIGGVNDLNRNLRNWGFGSTYLANFLPDLDGTNITTPKDISTMLYNLDSTNFLDITSRAYIYQIMSHVKNRFLIQASLPDNVQFIHKTGDIRNMLGDAGIVILPDGRKYIISALVKRPSNSYVAKQLIMDASKVTYASFATRDL